METAPEVITALRTFSQIMEELGIGGVAALMLFCPVVMAVAMFALDFLRQRHLRQEDAKSRQEAKKADDARRLEAKADRELIRQIMEDNRRQTAALVEVYRAETSDILRDLGAKHAEVTQFYKDNVELVKAAQRMTGDLRDIIVYNTRAFDRLSNIIESNFYCPMARKAATGKE